MLTTLKIKNDFIINLVVEILDTFCDYDKKYK